MEKPDLPEDHRGNGTRLCYPGGPRGYLVHQGGPGETPREAGQGAGGIVRKQDALAISFAAISKTTVPAVYHNGNQSMVHSRSRKV